MEICKPIIYEGTKDELISILESLDGSSKNNKHILTLKFFSNEELDIFRKKVGQKLLQNNHQNIIPQNNVNIIDDDEEDEEDDSSDFIPELELNLSIVQSYIDVPELMKTLEIYIGFKQIITYYKTDFKLIGKKYNCNINISRLFNEKLRIEGTGRGIELAKNEIGNIVNKFRNSKTLIAEYTYSKEELYLLVKYRYIQNLLVKYKCLLKLENINTITNLMNSSIKQLSLVIYCIDQKNKLIIIDALKKIRIIHMLYYKCKKMFNNHNLNNIEYNLRKEYIKEIFDKDILNPLLKEKLLEDYLIDEIKAGSNQKKLILLIHSNDIENAKQKIMNKLTKIYYLCIEHQISGIGNENINKDINVISSFDFEMKLKNQKIYVKSLLSKTNFRFFIVAKGKILPKVLEKIRDKFSHLFTIYNKYSIKVIFLNGDILFDEQKFINQSKDLKLKTNIILNKLLCCIIYIDGIFNILIKGINLIFNIKSEYVNKPLFSSQFTQSQPYQQQKQLLKPMQQQQQQVIIIDDDTTSNREIDFRFDDKRSLSTLAITYSDISSIKPSCNDDSIENSKMFQVGFDQEEVFYDYKQYKKNKQ